ncbi:zinc metalloprotease HtpX [Azospirillum sp. ST 5-10]|uniref:zinc metalloprotease HtpX n=1 Tax=unclassified Azospirillum TaxID=2630922 RepID=UPI003F4A7DE9
MNPTWSLAVHARRKRANLIQSALLLGGMVLLLGLCGWLVAGPEGVFWAFVAGAVGLAVGPRVSPRLVLAMFGARRLAPAEAPRLFAVVDAIARRAELPRPPDLYYLPSAALNAFTVGGRSGAAIAVTDGLLRALSLRELAGVLAHEISHVRNNDLVVMGLADLVASLTRFMSLFGMLLLLLNLPLVMMEREPVPWGLALVLTLAPLAGALLQLALSRTREFDADLDAARLTGDPVGLAAALERIERVQGRFWEGMMLPGRRNADPSLLRTHPETGERIRRLLELRAPAAMLPELEAMPVAVPFPMVVRRPRYRAHGFWY